MNMSKLGKSLIQGAKEALAYARKEKTIARAHKVHTRKAIAELESGKGKQFGSVDSFMKDLNNEGN